MTLYFCNSLTTKSIDRLARAGQACRRLQIDSLQDFTLFAVTTKKPRTAPASVVEDNNATEDFERSLSELEAIVERLERGELSLDESLNQFERGVKLTRVCQTALSQAEQKVEILMRKTGTDADPQTGFNAEPFAAGDDDNET